jgi:hypothetical protein
MNPLPVGVPSRDVTKILSDSGSQAEILFLATFDKMGFDQK